MIMTKNEIKLLKAFLIETRTTQKEFAKEAGICERTLRTAIKTGRISEKTWLKILDTIMAETVQIRLIKPEECRRVPAYIYNTLKVCYILFWACAVFALLNLIFG